MTASPLNVSDDPAIQSGKLRGLDVLGNPQINEVTKYENILVINLLLNSRPVRMSRSKSEHYKKNQVRACTTLKRREITKNYAFNFDIRN